MTTGRSGPTLVAVGHGSRDPAAATAMEGLLDAVRTARPGLDVRAAYLDHAEPRLRDLVGTLAGRLIVVPLLLSDAYHNRVDIPAALERVAGRAVQADVLGPDPLLLSALERRLYEAGVPVGDPRTAVVLTAAGSTDPVAAESIRLLAKEWRATGWADVTAAFASAASPTVGEAVAALRGAGAGRVVVASYLIFPGLFADRVATAARDAEASAVSAPLAGTPQLVDVVLARYDALT